MKTTFENIVFILTGCSFESTLNPNCFCVLIEWKKWKKKEN